MVEVEKRVMEILPYVIDGLSTKEICRYVSEIWGVGERQIERYKAAADKLLKEAAAIDRQTEVGRIRLRYEKLYRAAFADKDYRTALSVCREYCELFGLKAPTEIKSDTMLKVIIEKHEPKQIKD